MMRTDRYRSVAILFHWAIALLVIANFALGQLHESLLDGMKWVIPQHKSLGFRVLPYLPISQGTGTVARNAHSLLGWIMLALIAIHVAAALRYHFPLRDRVIARMLPRVRARS